MEVKIKYEDILKRCEMLSSFESEGKADANGESRYLEIHINKVDEQLIQQYIVQARAILEERMERMIVRIEDVVLEATEEVHAVQYFDEIIVEHPGYKYIVNNEAQPSLSGGKIVFVNDLSAFCYMKQGNTSAGTSGFTLYTDTTSLPFHDDYVFEKGKRKAYRLNDTSVYTWTEEGDGLIPYTIPDGPTRHDGFTWEFRTTTRWNGIRAFTKHVNEAIVSYAMAAWLRGKLDERVPFYESLFNNTLAQAVKNVFTKQAPTYG